LVEQKCVVKQVSHSGATRVRVVSDNTD
jgi:hypothetical protein